MIRVTVANPIQSSAPKTFGPRGVFPVKHWGANPVQLPWMSKLRGVVFQTPEWIALTACGHSALLITPLDIGSPRDQTQPLRATTTVVSGSTTPAPQ